MAEIRNEPEQNLQVNYIDPNDKASLDRFLDGMAAGFCDAAMSRAFITEVDKTPPPYPSPAVNVARIRKHITQGITNSAYDGAELVEAGNYSALAVWETTTYRGQPFTETMRNMGPIREEWRAVVREYKEKYVGLETKKDGSQDFKPFYHLGFLVRNPNEPSVPGAISAVMRPWLQRAEDEGVPVWLEATNPHAVEVYKHLGFRLVEQVKIAVGARDAIGWPKDGGEGVSAYAMIYDAHLKQDT